MSAAKSAAVSPAQSTRSPRVATVSPSTTITSSTAMRALCASSSGGSALTAARSSAHGSSMAAPAGASASFGSPAPQRDVVDELHPGERRSSRRGGTARARAPGRAARAAGSPARRRRRPRREREAARSSSRPSSDCVVVRELDRIGASSGRPPSLRASASASRSPPSWSTSPRFGRLLARPHPPRADRVDLVGLHVAALGDARDEHVVELLHLHPELARAPRR